MTSLIDIESAADDAFDYVGEMLFARLNKPPELSRCWRRSKPAGVTDIAWDEQLHRLLKLKGWHASNAQPQPQPQSQGGKTGMLPPSLSLMPKRSSQAAQDSWNRPFGGQALQGLFEALDDVATAATHNSAASELTKAYYARILPCVQSSGTGKSRLFHEAAAVIFTLPVCWRTRDSSGYPLRDDTVCEMFAKHRLERRVEEELFWQAFLTSLLLETIHCIDSGKLTDRPEQWRDYFTSNMTCRSHNEHRSAFYNAVTSTANQLITVAQQETRRPFLASYRQAGTTCTLPSVALDLQRRLQFAEEPPCKIKLNIVFDEAHLAFAPSLLDPNEDLLPDLFIAFREAVRLLRDLPFTFSLLSTSASVREHIVPPAGITGLSARARPQKFAAPPPFSLVGWDQGLHQMSLNSARNPDEFSRLVHYGRPLFGATYLYEDEHASPSEKEEGVIELATSKLLGSPERLYLRNLDSQQLLALFGSLLPLSLSPQIRPPEVVSKHQNEQVRHHMATLDRLSPHIEALCVVRPSEPLLAIAAGRRLHIKEDALILHLLDVAALLQMSRNERREVIAQLFLIAAQHRATLLKSSVISDPPHPHFPYLSSDLFKSVPLEEYLQRLLVVTDNALDMVTQFSSRGRVRVCQFIKREQNSLPEPEDLSTAHVRGCAFACCVHQWSAILIVPLVFEGQDPGAVMVEIKTQGESRPESEQKAMFKLRDIREKMFSGARTPRCVFICLDLAADSNARSSHSAARVCRSEDDPSLLHIFVDGLESLSILQHTSSIGQKLPCNLGTPGQVDDWLGRGEVTTTLTEHQQTVRETMNPLCGTAPGHRQFWDSGRAGSSEEASTNVSGSKKRKGNSCPDE